MTPTKSEVLANHERYVERKALYKRFGYDIEQERSFIIEKARPISGRILEAGTGKGYFTLALAQEGVHFTSFDISEAEQKYALLNLMYYGLEQQAHFDIANAECLAYEAGSFDVIFTVNMVHHLSSARKVCDELVRVLAPSGKMVWSDFNSQGLVAIDKIHALEGRRHEVGASTLTDMMELLIEWGFWVEQHQGVTQDTLIAYRRHS